MVLIINTTGNDDITDEIQEKLEESSTEYEVLDASQMNISNCIGCNQCWLKTPGVCLIKDDYEKIFKKMLTADQMWVIADTKLGFLDHRAKNIFDRIVPMLNMMIYFKGKQMRHEMRYDNRMDLGVIYNGKVDRDFLTRWSQRCALNLDSNSLGVYPVAEIKEAAACMQ